MTIYAGPIVLGVLVTAFFALIWLRIENIDKTLITAQVDLEQFHSEVKNLRGRVDELSKKVGLSSTPEGDITSGPHG